MNLTTPEGVAEYMTQATSAADWDARIAVVKTANGGGYPSFWFQTIIMSGLLSKTAAKWGDDGEIKVVLL